MAMEQADFVDKVAQAVIDKIEEQNQTTRLINAVALRVIELQKQADELQDKVSADAEHDADKSHDAAASGTEKKDGTNG